MYGVVPSLDFPKNMTQLCPLCGTKQFLLVAGTVRNPENFNKRNIVLDRGYSFCNCRNIFFTNWENIDQALYDEVYSNRYDFEHVKKIMKQRAEYFNNEFKLIPGKRLLEIGSSNPFFLDEARSKGAITIGVDIDTSIQENGHKFIHGDIENETTIDEVNRRSPYDYIVMMHVIEHLKDPIKALKNIISMLNTDGKMLMMMPDPFFIHWNNVYTWDHWHIREHHIMWDMGSFCDLMAELGMKTIFTKRNTTTMTADCTMIFEKCQ